jgi:signal peptidase I
VSRAQRLARFVERSLAFLGAFFLVYHAFFEVSRLTTGSMAPALLGTEKGEPDRILVETFFTKRRAPPKRFDIVSFDDEEGIAVAKRVVGFPGETLVVTREGKLLVNGEPVATPAGIGRGRGYLAAGNLRHYQPFVVPAGKLYLLGDDSQDSMDSRFTGALEIDKVRGRVLLRVWPPSRIGCP